MQETVIVPAHLAQAVIGKDRKNIQSIGDVSGATIFRRKVEKNDDAILVVSGTRSQVDLAVDLIRRDLDMWIRLAASVEVN